MAESYVPTANRRSYMRFPTQSSSVMLGVSKEHAPLLLKNISARGIGVVGSHPLDVGKEVGVTIVPNFFLKNGTFRKAKVAWCNAWGKGLWCAGLDFGVGYEIEFA